MSKTTSEKASTSRLLRSAGVLRAYFEHKLAMSFELLTEEPSDILNSGMQFGLELSGSGIWGLRSSEELSEDIQLEISATFQNLLGAMARTENRVHDLIRFEKKIECNLEELPSNVIPLHRSSLPKRRLFSVVQDKRWHLRSDCLIESPLESEIHKMALELHSHSQRYAFVEYASLNRHARLNLSELLQVGEVTIYVPSILSLSHDEQQVLSELLKVDTGDRPLLMVGANVPYAALQGELTIHLEFLALISRSYIKLTRPFSDYKDQGLIHYFLDSLSQNPT